MPMSVANTADGLEQQESLRGEGDRQRHMKALADHVHAKGLKPGIYSSPSAKTYRLEGPLGQEQQ